MLKSCDSGSLPFIGDFEKFLKGAKRLSLNQLNESSDYFEKKVIETFLDKIRVNIDVPNYPQFRDITKMFFSMMNGVEKNSSGYLETKTLSLNPDESQIPEVLAIERNSQIIQEKIGKPFEVRLCITGPYTLASFFPYKNKEIFKRLGNVISQILERNLFSNKYGKISLVSIDEPIFGFLDDPNIDFGSEGRENLRSAWETIFHKVRSKNTQTMMHLHSTANPLFWDVESLMIIDSHVNDPLHQMKKTSEMLESKNKFLKASISINDFDILIKKIVVTDSRSNKMTESKISEKIADTWTEIKNQKVDPEIFLESAMTMKKRLNKLVDQFGMERILYAGPECGLKGYPSYDSALECLRRVAFTTKCYEK
jgi:methionine synthase II (cobalamin-independent)